MRCLKREVAHDVILQFDCLNSFHNFQKHMTARVPCFAFVSNFNLQCPIWAEPWFVRS